MAQHDIDIDSFIRLLQADPDARQRVLHALIPDWPEVLRLISSLTESVTALTHEVTGLTASIDALRVETDRRLTKIEADVAVLKTDVAVLKTDVSVLKTDVAVLKTDMHWVRNRLGHHTGKEFERDMTNNPRGILGAWLRYPRDGSQHAQDAVEAAVDDGRLTMAERFQVVKADFIWRGKAPSDGQDVFVVAEVSSTAGRSDITRAAARAAIVARAGLRAVGAVVAERWSAPLLRVAAQHAVLAFDEDHVDDISAAAVETSLATPA